MSVERSRECESSREKRELTRQLGVCAALYLLTEMAMEKTSDGSLDDLARQNAKMLSRMGNYMITDHPRVDTV